MHGFLNTKFGIGIVTLSAIHLSSCTDIRQENPSFIIILIDDLGAQDLGCYGQKYIETPNIDLLATQGMKWVNAYSSCPVCSPTRVALLTGKNQARINFTGHITRTGKHRHPDNSLIIPPEDLMDLPHEEVILPEALKTKGYRSISIGKWHVGREGHWPTDLGFDRNIAGWTHGMSPSHFYPYENEDEPWNANIPTLKNGKPGEYLTDRLTDEAIKFIKKNKRKPFLLYLSHYAVHVPLQAPAEIIDKYDSVLKGSVINPVYAAMVESVDNNVGRILVLLDKLKLTDNTVIIFTSDNGALESVTDNSPFRRGKGHLYEGGIRVPFIMRWPGHITPKSVCESPVISYDIYTTILDIADIKIQSGSNLDGRSLTYDFHNHPLERPIDLYWYYPHYSPQGNMPGAAILKGDYKLIQFYDPPRVELYNIKNDIHEDSNLADSLSEMKDYMLHQLHEWLKETNPIMHAINPNYNADK